MRIWTAKRSTTRKMLNVRSVVESGMGMLSVSLVRETILIRKKNVMDARKEQWSHMSICWKMDNFIPIVIVGIRE
jgi:hypothetical protein